MKTKAKWTIAFVIEFLAVILGIVLTVYGVLMPLGPILITVGAIVFFFCFICFAAEVY